MPNAERAVYETALPRVKAQYQAILLDASAFPHMKEAAQKRVHSRLERDLKRGLPRDLGVEKPASQADLAERGGGVGIGMTFVDANGNPISAANDGSGRPEGGEG